MLTNNFQFKAKETSARIDHIKHLRYPVVSNFLM